jgi:sterol desaturase/sphingolipid hydroxylase (fatty acid hydroxylase superfamily)
MNETIEELAYHPVSAGMAAFTALVVSLLGPAATGYAAVVTGVVVLPFGLTYLLGVAAALVGFVLFNRVLHRTHVYGWVAEFLTWASKAGLNVPGGERV